MAWQDKAVESKEALIAKSMLKKYLNVHSVVKDTKSEEEAIQALIKWIKTWDRGE